MNPLGKCLLAALLGLAVLPAAALDPARPPGGNFDLTHWKLTLPDAAASEIAASSLVAGYTNASFFYTGPDGAMVFWCPVTGGTTSGSSYPRSELREVLDPADDNVNWTGYGTNILTAQCRVTQVPSTGKTIIGQIHGFTGNAYPLVKLQYQNGTIVALVKESPNSDTDTHFNFMNVGLGNPISYQIKLVNGLLSLTVNGSNQAVNIFQTDPAWATNTLYFKAGDYCQDNSGSNTEAAQVMFYQLSATHAASVPAFAFTNWSGGSTGRFSATLAGAAGSNYVFQASSNLAGWLPLATNSSPTGAVSFTDTNAVTGRKFYRALAQ
jgi:Alginate lyase